ncbi:MAG: iron-containing alcohol dehydrogenase [Anaerolineae bacterium]|nr:iron-containing alcohol dehydrogenase [Anaerolineae bacterium]
MHIWPIPKIEFMSFAEIVESRSVALVTGLPAWQAVKNRLSLPVVWQADVKEATLSHWDAFLADLRGEVVYAVGGGLAVDAAKYVAARCNLPLVCLPTALSVDAFFTWASGIRRDGCVAYIETKPPDLLVIDCDVLAAAPISIRAAAICDVLSIATGSWDWRLAEQRGRNAPETAYLSYVDQIAAGILQGAIDCAEAVGDGDPEGFKQLLDCLALEVQLCNQIGHARPEEGSEHYFAYAVENEMGKGLPHGDLVGPGIVLMAERQGQDVQPLRRALEMCHIPLGAIPEAVVQSTLHMLPEYVREHDLPYGIAHELSSQRDRG